MASQERGWDYEVSNEVEILFESQDDERPLGFKEFEEANEHVMKKIMKDLEDHKEGTSKYAIRFRNNKRLVYEKHLKWRDGKLVKDQLFSYGMRVISFS